MKRVEMKKVTLGEIVEVLHCVGLEIGDRFGKVYKGKKQIFSFMEFKYVWKKKYLHWFGLFFGNCDRVPKGRKGNRTNKI